MPAGASPSKRPAGSTGRRSRGMPSSGRTRAPTASGRQARTTVRPSSGCGPSTRWGSCRSRAARRRASSGATVTPAGYPDAAASTPREAGTPSAREDVADAGDGDADPLGPVPQLVAQLVERLLELEDGEELVDGRAAARQEPGG